MKLTIKKQVEETVDIELPFYTVYAGAFRKILSEKDMIEVEDSEAELSIRVRHKYCDGVIANAILDGKTIAASVFDNALQSALTKLNAMAQKESVWGGNDEGEETFEEMQDEKNDLRHVNI